MKTRGGVGQQFIVPGGGVGQQFIVLGGEGWVNTSVSGGGGESTVHGPGKRWATVHGPRGGPDEQVMTYGGLTIHGLGEEQVNSSWSWGGGAEGGFNSPWSGGQQFMGGVRSLVQTKLVSFKNHAVLKFCHLKSCTLKSSFEIYAVWCAIQRNFGVQLKLWKMQETWREWRDRSLISSVLILWGYMTSETMVGYLLQSYFMSDVTMNEACHLGWFSRIKVRRQHRVECHGKSSPLYMFLFIWFQLGK